MEASPTRFVTATIRRVIYHAQDSGFAVAEVVTSEGATFTAAGLLGDPTPESTYKLEGGFEDHPRFGPRFKVASAIPVTPDSLDGMRRFLASGRFEGVGETTAARIVDELGLATFDALAGDGDIRIKGLAGKKLAALRAAVRAARVEIETHAFLAGIGLGPALSAAVIRAYGPMTATVTKENPWKLAEDIRGIGFLTADRLGRQLGFAPNHPLRLRAGLLHALLEATEQGHTCLPNGLLVERAAELLTVDHDIVSEALRAAEGDDAVVVERAYADTARAYHPDLHAFEVEAAHRVSRLLFRPALLDEDDLPAEVPEHLSDEQRRAVALLLKSPVALLTGGPGVGKTTVIDAVVRCITALGKSVQLAAPTGRAARRMEEATGREAATIHRLLGIQPSDSFDDRPPPDPILADCLVVDEASMLDLPLFVQILRGLVGKTSLILVGDPDQLPSVGPGNVLSDLVTSRIVPCASLTRIFRQERGGLLVRNAHAVREGSMPDDPEPGEVTDYYFMERADATEGAALIRELVSKRLPAKFGFDPSEDIQVLTPMHKGACGTESLNTLLQESLREGARTAKRNDRTFREGDRVIATRNDYERNLANGETGRVVGVIDATGEVTGQFGTGVHRFKPNEWDDLQLSYTLTVHKSQGSEYPAVVLPLFNEHWPMLRRAVLYTAMTRARKLLVVVGQRSALARAVDDARKAERFSLLSERLSGISRSEGP